MRSALPQARPAGSQGARGLVELARTAVGLACCVYGGHRAPSKRAPGPNQWLNPIPMHPTDWAGLKSAPYQPVLNSRTVASKSVQVTEPPPYLGPGGPNPNAPIALAITINNNLGHAYVGCMGHHSMQYSESTSPWRLALGGLPFPSRHVHLSSSLRRYLPGELAENRKLAGQKRTSETCAVAQCSMRNEGPGPPNGALRANCSTLFRAVMRRNQLPENENAAGVGSSKDTTT
jgi:hypothetical protein